MGEFNSDDHYIYYCRQESLRKNQVAIMVKKESKMQYFNAISKTTERSLFVSKANQSISQLSKSMPQPVMLKKLKLNGFMKTRTPGDGDGPGGLACCDSWGRKKSDMTERLI